MTLNLNVGILGHVDSGKTTLARALSEVASTAAFDKNPQSKERGITLDLGFSAFTLDIPDQLASTDYKKVQYTLVDCPGHASLIRTIIGGSQIIDLMLLVVDVTRGMQTQTAECLIIGEITCKKMIVVFNKIDLLDSEKKIAIIERMRKKFKLTLSNTNFRDYPIVSLSALSSIDNKSCIEDLLSALNNVAFLPLRQGQLPFVLSVDHCFSIKGQGTVLTGTILQGSIKLNDSIEIPNLNVTKKIKSMQMFKQPRESATQGDRVGICVTHFDPKLLERGLVCHPGFVSFIYAAVIDIQKIKYFKGNIVTQSKYHITMGHETVLASVTLFGLPKIENTHEEFSCDHEYLFQKEYIDTGQADDYAPQKQYALLEFEKSVLAVPKCLVIGSKLDMDIDDNSCRIAFWGRLQKPIGQKDYHTTVLPTLKIYKKKQKEGIVERVVNENEIIVKHMFKKETNLQVFIGLTVTLASGEEGKIEGGFGLNGKVKVVIPQGLKKDTFDRLQFKKSEKKTILEPIKVILNFKRYIYDASKKIYQ